MGLLSLFGFGKKAELLEWQNDILADACDKLIMTEAQLRRTTETMAKRELEIIQDCVRLLGSTVKPDVFFSRLDLLIESGERLTIYEKYIQFSGAAPSAAYVQLMEQQQECIFQFIMRYFMNILDQVDKAKTTKGKLNKYQKFYDSLQPYYPRMNEKSIDYIETKYRVYSESLMETK